jgi:hypothetical protein
LLSHPHPPQPNPSLHARAASTIEHHPIIIIAIHHHLAHLPRRAAYKLDAKTALAGRAAVRNHRRRAIFITPRTKDTDARRYLNRITMDQGTSNGGRPAAAAKTPEHSPVLSPTDEPDRQRAGRALPSSSSQDSFAPGAQSPESTSSRGGGDRDSDDWDFPPLDRLTLLDLLDNFALAAPLERIQRRISAHTHQVRRSQEAILSKGQVARERMVEEWRRRVPSAEEQLDRYSRRMRDSVDKLSRRWNDTKAITLREKISFIFGVLNIFASGYLIGGHPEWFHVWFTAQLLYFMPIRIFTFRQMGYQYFLVDLCYFVNVLLLLSIWVFPHSKRLFMAVYCLAFGNNAVAIIMWRNSLVFHSLDKITSLFIHIMPCATLHCIIHLLPQKLAQERFPGMWEVKHSSGSSAAYGSLWSMLLWSTIPYVFWQLSYHFFITVRRKDKIAAGRPTSFVWLRKTYSKSWIGKLVMGLPENLQVFAFMLIQYLYAVSTMIPCPIWFHSRLGSSLFLLIIFTWSVYNGSTYYIDVFGNRFQKELESMKQEVARWQHSSELIVGPATPGAAESGDVQRGAAGGQSTGIEAASAEASKRR